MTINLRLHHETTYHYDNAVFLGPHYLRLKPAYHSRVPTSDYELSISPRPCALHWQQDPFANPVARAIFDGAINELKIVVQFRASLIPVNPFDFFIEPDSASWPFQYPDHCRELTAFFQCEPPSPEMNQWLATLPSRSDYIVDYLVQLNLAVYDRVKYQQRDEQGVQTPQETLNSGIGSCRDSAWLFVQSLRQIGLMSRFVSGYLIQPESSDAQTQSMSLPASGSDVNAPAMNQSQTMVSPANATDTSSGYTASLHAWTEAYLPGAGWIGMDPTSGMMAGEGHLPLAATPCWQEAAPVTGTHEQSEVKLQHHLTVTVQ